MKSLTPPTLLQLTPDKIKRALNPLYRRTHRHFLGLSRALFRSGGTLRFIVIPTEAKRSGGTLRFIVIPTEAKRSGGTLRFIVIPTEAKRSGATLRFDS